MPNTNSIDNVYSTGTVTAVDYSTAGGLIGSIAITNLSDSFWNLNGNGSSTVVAVTSKTAPEMKDVDTYTDTATSGLSSAWDFVDNPNDDVINSDYWDIKSNWNNGYPCLTSIAASCSNPNETDGDGVANSVEDAAPNGGNGNDDGILDSQQSTVASALNPETSKYVTMISTDCDVTLNGFTPSSSTVNLDRGFKYEHGLVDFTLSCTAGTSDIVALYFHDMAEDDFLMRKLNSVTNEFSSVAGGTFSYGDFYGAPVTYFSYQITDGGYGDDDGVVNVVIVDPVGLASFAPAAVPPNTLLVQVIAPPRTAAGSLPATGTSIAFIVSLGIGLIGAGFILARKRRKAVS